jgi:enoyl-[acyl-carrier protein] reductase I
MDQFDQLIDEARARAPVRRLVSIEDVGAIAVGLVGDFTQNLTGGTANVDGG